MTESYLTDYRVRSTQGPENWALCFLILATMHLTLFKKFGLHLLNKPPDEPEQHHIHCETAVRFDENLNPYIIEVNLFPGLGHGIDEELSRYAAILGRAEVFG